MKTLLHSLIIAIVALASLPTHLPADVVYVDDDAPKKGNGSSWSRAFRYLQDALNKARDPQFNVTEIRVGQGAYFPDLTDRPPFETPGDRDASFELVEGVTIKGGYAGYGVPGTDPGARDVGSYVTTLSGHLGVQARIPGHLYHVVLASNH